METVIVFVSRILMCVLIGLIVFGIIYLFNKKII